MNVDQVVGSYYRPNSLGVVEILELKTDYIFEYRCAAGLMSETTSGSWTQEGNNIILNSEQQPLENGIDAYEIINVERGTSDSISVELMDNHNESIFQAEIQIKKDTTVMFNTMTDYDGIATLPKMKEIDSLIIVALAFQTIRLELDSTVLSYTFKMRGPGLLYRYFTNEAWPYDAGRLFDPKSNGTRNNQSKYLVKTENK